MKFKNPLLIFLLSLVTMSTGFQTIVLGGLFGPGQPDSATRANYYFRHFTDENGLPQNSIRCLAPDKDGFLWIGTEKGLVRFDGNRFVREESMLSSIDNNRILYFQKSLNERNFYAVNNANNYLLINDGKYKIDTVNYKSLIQKIPYLVSGKAEWNNQSVISNGLPAFYSKYVVPEVYLIFDKENSYYVCKDSVIEYVSQGKKKYEISFSAPEKWDLLKIGQNLYYTSPDGTFTQLSRSGNKSSKLTGDILKDPAYNRGRKDFVIYWNAISNQVFLYLNKNFYTLRETQSGTLETTQIFSNFDFGANYIVSVYYDSVNQSLFLGSLSSGLFYFKKQQFMALRANTGHRDNVYYAQALYGDNAVITAQGNVLSPFLSKEKILNTMKNRIQWDLFSMLRDKRGNYWSAIHGELYEFNHTGEQVLRHWTVSDKVTMIYQDATERIWLGVVNKGVYMIDPKEKDPVPREVYRHSALKAISYFLFDQAKDELWVGTREGLFKISLKTRKLTYITALKNVYVRSLYMPRSGELWITTYSKGLFLLTDKKLTNFPLDDHQFLAGSHCIVEDSKGFFWIPTNKGLFQASKKDLVDYADGKRSNVYYQYYNKADGFNTNEFNGGCQPCAIKLNNGYVSLPSLDGLVWYHPESINPGLPKEQFFIDDIKIDEKDIVVRDTLELPNEYSYVRIALSTPYFGSPDNIHFQYKIDKEQQWRNVDGTQVITLYKLPFGEHTLHIRKINGFGSEYSERIVKVRVTPAWYQNWWFIVMACVLLAVAIYDLIKLRTVYLTMRNKRLELRIAKRTLKLKTAMEKLRNSQDSLSKQAQIQERIIAVMGHDFRTPLRYLNSVSQRVYDQLKKQDVDEDLLEQSKSIRDSTIRLYHLADGLLHYMRSKIRSDLGMSYDEVDLYEVLKAKTELFEDIGRANNSELVNTTSPGLLVYTNKSMVEIVIHNLLDNAVKSSLEGQVTVSSQRLEDKVSVIISDTGGGMPERLIKWINPTEEAATETTADTPPENIGMGLIIVKELTHLLGIRMEVTLNPMGTTIFLYFGR